MSQMRETDTVLSKAQDQGEFSLIQFFIMLAKHKKLVVGLPLVFGTLSIAISLALPNIYRAGTKLLPPQQAQSGAAALLSQLGGVAGAAAGAVGVKNPADLYIAMLKSRTVADNLISKFELKKVYDTDSMEKARRTLEGNTFISAAKDGTITIEVEDKDQKLVAPITNAYVLELTRLTKVMAVTEASQRRIFFERQLEMAKNNLASAEVSLKDRLDTHGVISVDADSRAIVETIARLRAQTSAKEIELESMSAFVTAQNPAYLKVVQELSSLKAELARLENGRPNKQIDAGSRTDNSDGLESVKILRNIKYQQMLYELLAKQYEVARLDEAKDAPLIQVLDPAIEPEQKFKPKRLFIVLVFIVVGLILAIGLVLMREAKARLLRSTDGLAYWREFKNNLKFK